MDISENDVFPQDTSVFKSRTTITGIVKALRRMKGGNKQDARTFKGQDYTRSKFHHNTIGNPAL